MAHILAIDDEQPILSMIKRILCGDGHCVTTLCAPEEIKNMSFDSYDLILLDVMMPAIDGFTLCKEIRNLADCPILFLTAKTGEEDLVIGLGAGADDYITKPFGKMELRARVAAHLRREKREHLARLSFSESYFLLSSRQLFIRDIPVPLTKSEYAICEYLARNAGQVFSKEQIYEGVFGFDGVSFDNTITTHIKNIRAKIEQLEYSPIKTVWGIGYKWEK